MAASRKNRVKQMPRFEVLGAPPRSADGFPAETARIRAASRLSRTLYSIASAMKLLCTHYLGIIRKL